MIEELLSPTVTEDARLEVVRKYWFLQMPCPFLVDESCSIHPHRPVACREYNVTSPVEWCAEPFSHEVAKVAMPFPLSLPLARLTAELIDTTPSLIPLTLVPRWAEDHAELGKRTWPGLELFRRFMIHLSPGSAASTSGA